MNWGREMNNQQNQELKERLKEDNVVIQVIPFISTFIYES